MNPEPVKMMYAVIMAGGSGTRFWPLSREAWPKQFLKVCGRKTLLQETFDRIEPLVTAERTFIVANPQIAEKCAVQLPALPRENMILEPMARNTAPAIGLAAFRLMKRDAHAVMVILPADHYIEDREAFCRVLKIAAEAALSDYLVTLGLTPTSPETGYGYIRKGEKGPPLKTGGGEAYPVGAFTEKPDPETAARYVQAGNYFWNSGIFIWKASVLLQEMEMHMPSLFERLSRMAESSSETEREAIFRSITPESIDYGIMEKSRGTVMVKADFRWHDVGSLSALDQINETDEAKNLIMGNVISLDNEDSIIYGGDRLIAAMGLRNLMVVDTPDATLVSPKNRAQEVRHIVEILKKEKRPEYLDRREKIFDWGKRLTLDQGRGFEIRKVEIHPGKALDSHAHQTMDERWFLLSGAASVTRGDEILKITGNQGVFIPRGIRHCVKNMGTEKLTAVEIQLGG